MQHVYLTVAVLSLGAGIALAAPSALPWALLLVAALFFVAGAVVAGEKATRERT